MGKWVMTDNLGHILNNCMDRKYPDGSVIPSKVYQYYSNKIKRFLKSSI